MPLLLLLLLLRPVGAVALRRSQSLRPSLVRLLALLRFDGRNRFARSSFTVALLLPVAMALCVLAIVLLLLVMLVTTMVIVVLMTVVKSNELVVDKGDLTNSELIYC
jgi:hypothetical protein